MIALRAILPSLALCREHVALSRNHANMKEYIIKLNAKQVLALFEMCEHCSTVIHQKHPEAVSAPDTFGLVMSIQDKIDGCEEMNMDKPSLLDEAEAELDIKEFIIPELVNKGSLAKE